MAKGRLICQNNFSGEQKKLLFFLMVHLCFSLFANTLKGGARDLKTFIVFILWAFEIFKFLIMTNLSDYTVTKIWGL